MRRLRLNRHLRPAPPAWDLRVERQRHRGQRQFKAADRGRGGGDFTREVRDFVAYWVVPAATCTARGHKLDDILGRRAGAGGGRERGGGADRGGAGDCDRSVVY